LKYQSTNSNVAGHSNPPAEGVFSVGGTCFELLAFGEGIPVRPVVLIIGILAAIASMGITRQAGDGAPRYTITDLGRFGSPAFYPEYSYGINKSGQVVGAAHHAGGSHAFLHDGASLRDLGVLPGTIISSASAINDHVQIVGDSITPAGHGGRGGETRIGVYYGFLWEDGRLTKLPGLGGRYDYAVGINNRGQILGRSQGTDNKYHVVIWQKGRISDLTQPELEPWTPAAINDRGDVVGYRHVAKTHTLLWSRGNLRDLGALGEGRCIPTAMNERGDIVGTCLDANVRPFLLHKGRFQYLETLNVFQNNNGVIENIGGRNSSPASINNKGQIVGQSGFHACLWDKGRVYDLNELIPAEKGLRFGRASSINDRGQIAANGSGHDRSSVYLLSPVTDGPKR
jgi:probable HAF family extracellular repeat protein